MKSRSSCFSMVSLVFLFFLSLASFATGVAPAKNGNRVKPGQFVVGDPTLICLGFEWSIDGDDNHNAAVAVQYRKKGTGVWKEALPLLRLQNEEAGGSLTPGTVVPNMFAGSILDLEPDTEYECKFQTVQLMYCQAKCCMLRNNCLDNAPAKQVIENHIMLSGVPLYTTRSWSRF
jgi:hypothetical protein